MKKILFLPNHLQSKIGWLMALLMLGINTAEVQAQVDDQDDKCCTSTIYIYEAYGGESNDWSVPGLTYDLSIDIANSFDLLFRAHALRWSDARQSTLSVNIGPSATISDNGSWIFDMYFVGGTVGISGSDYAGFFGHLEVGATLSKILGNGHALRFNLSGHEGMAFHPSSYSYLQLSVGYSL